MFKLLTLAPGVLVVVFGLYEVFQDLFHPTRTGSLSDVVSRCIFVLFRRRRSTVSVAGPLALVVVILCWVFLIAAGFALIYWSSLPSEFQFSTGKNPGREAGFASALYFSLEVLTTLGLGDLTPKAGWLRMVVTFEALVGFSLLTASVSWVLLIYPALARKVTFARRVSAFVHAERESGVELIAEDAEYLLGDLVLEVIRTRVDLIHFPIIYYFHSYDDRSSLRNANRTSCDSSNKASGQNVMPKCGSPQRRFEPHWTIWQSYCGCVTSRSTAQILRTSSRRSPKISVQET